MFSWNVEFIDWLIQKKGEMIRYKKTLNNYVITLNYQNTLLWVGKAVSVLSLGGEQRGSVGSNRKK